MWVLKYVSDIGTQYYWNGRTWTTDRYSARLYHNERGAKSAKRNASPWTTQWYVPYDEVNVIKADWT